MVKWSVLSNLVTLDVSVNNAVRATMAASATNMEDHTAASEKLIGVWKTQRLHPFRDPIKYNQ